jgi:hypothetical protein
LDRFLEQARLANAGLPGQHQHRRSRPLQMALEQGKLARAPDEGRLRDSRGRDSRGEMGAHVVGEGVSTVPARRRHERGSLLGGELQCVSEQAHSVVPGRVLDAPLEVADGPGAQVRPLGQRLLR